MKGLKADGSLAGELVAVVDPFGVVEADRLSSDRLETNRNGLTVKVSFSIRYKLRSNSFLS